MTKLEKARALKCFGKLIECVELDPDRKLPIEFVGEFRCNSCGKNNYCGRLFDTLENKW